MRKMLNALIVTTALSALPVAALAENRALIIANSDYDTVTDVDVTALSGASTGLRDAGWSVVSLTDADTAEIRNALRKFADPDDTPGSRIIMLGGHFTRSLSESWFMGRSAKRPDLVSADLSGVNLRVVMDIAAQTPGRAVVMLDAAKAEMPVGLGLTPGLGDLNPPQGVAILLGEADALVRAAEELSGPGTSLESIASASESDLTAEGFLPKGWAFVPRGGAAPVPAPNPAPAPDTRADDAAWAQALEGDTKASYQSYLDTWPQGVHAAEANAALERLRAASPAAQAEAAEAALALSKDARKRIQRQLTLLDYNTRGIDGIFGPGTRGSVKGWQEANGHQPTGFLTARQIEAIATQASERQARLEAEARARQEAKNKADEALWATLGQNASEAQLRQYLKEYPDGLHAKEAQDRLNQIAASRDAAEAKAEKTAWAKADAAGSVAELEAFLERFPNGAHAETARARLDQMKKASAVDTAAAQQEAALGLNDAARQIIEQRLQSLDLSPGKVDGTFDADSRAALRRYQSSRGLPVTGYMNEPTAVRLLADTLLQ